MKSSNPIRMILVFTLALSMLFSTTAFGGTKEMLAKASGDPSSATTLKTTKITRDQAISIAKTMLADPSLFDTSNISLNPNYSSTGSSWYINFYKKTSLGGNASVTVDAETGDITGYNLWDNSSGQQNFIATLTRSEAKEKADQYIEKELKLKLDEYEFQKDDPNYNNYYYGGVKQQIIYNFTYIKKVNGLPFSNYTLTLGVDGSNGKITSFNKNVFNLSKVKFPSAKNILSTGKAMDQYKSSAQIVLQYITTYESMPYGISKPKINLVYLPFTYINMLDAVSGKPINYDGSIVNTDPVKFKKLTENPTPLNASIKIPKNAISEAQAIKKAESYKALVEGILKVKFDPNNNMQSSSYSMGLENIWSYNWYKNVGSLNYSMNIGISGDTGRISSLSFNVYDNNNQYGTTQPVVKEKYNWLKSKKKALDVLKKVLPEQYGAFVDENITEPELSADSKKYQKEHYFNFTRLVNGIRFRDNNIGINVDRETGNIKSFYFSWSDFNFPSTSNVITKEAASKAYYDGFEAKLSYFVQTTYNRSGTPIIGDSAKLVYNFSNSRFPLYSGYNLDATTGKFIDYAGSEIQPLISNGSISVEENWAKRSIDLLVAQGILRKKSIDTKETLTKYEAIKMLSLTKGMNYYDPKSLAVQTFSDVPKTDDYFTYIENAVTQKIITETTGEFKGNEIMTKAEFSKLLIQLLGYSDIAKFGDIFKSDTFVNVPPSHTGYVAICKALKVLPVEPDKTFDGSEAVNYSEASDALYKALTYIK